MHENGKWKWGRMERGRKETKKKNKNWGPRESFYMKGCAVGLSPYHIRRGQGRMDSWTFCSFFALTLLDRIQFGCSDKLPMKFSFENNKTLPQSQIRGWEGDTKEKGNCLGYLEEKEKLYWVT
jgi:hypothetical protein